MSTPTIPSTLIKPTRANNGPIVGAVTAVASRFVDADYGYEIASGTAGFTTGDQLSAGENSVVALVEILGGPGYIMGQHDGTNGIRVVLDADGKLYLEVDGTRSSDGIKPTRADALVLAFDGSKSTLAVNGLVVALIAAAPTLPAQDFTFGASGETADGTRVRFAGIAFYADYLAHLYPSPDSDTWGVSTGILDGAPEFQGLDAAADHIFALNGDVANSGNSATPATLTASGAVPYVDDRNASPNSAARCNASATLVNSGPGMSSAGDFFVGFWAKENAAQLTQSNQALWCTNWNGGYIAIGFRRSSGGAPDLTIEVYNGLYKSASTQPVWTDWNHYALQRVGSTINLWLNGALVATAITSFTPSATWQLCRNPGWGTSTNFDIDDLVFHDGELITDPAAGFPADGSAPPNGTTPTITVGYGEQNQAPAFYGWSGQLAPMGWNPQGDTDEARLGLAWNPFTNDPRQALGSAPVTQSLQPTQDTWITRNMQERHQQVIIDLRYGSMAYSGYSDNFARFPGNTYRGTISGTLTDENASPVSRLVRLLDRRSGRVVREQWADANGGYNFADLDTRRQYTVLAHDYTGTYNAVVRDDVSAA